MTEMGKNVKNSDFLVNMKYAVFCCFWIICIWYKCGKCDILQDLYGGTVNFVIVENKNMDKKGKCENLGENSSENVKISDFEVW